jgi:hypothetical protein
MLMAITMTILAAVLLACSIADSLDIAAARKRRRKKRK